MEQVVDVGGNGGKLRVEEGWLVWQGADGKTGTVPVGDVAVLMLSEPGISGPSWILERIKKRHGHVWIGQTPIFPMPTLTLRQSLPMAFQIAIQRGRRRMPRIRGVRRRPHFEDFLNPRGGAVAEPSDKSEFDAATSFLNPI